jgi:deoxyribonuclease-4
MAGQRIKRIKRRGAGWTGKDSGATDGSEQTMVNDPLIGAHMSIAGGLSNALLRGQELGCGTIQIFTKNNNQWKAKGLTSKEAKKFSDHQRETGISPVLGHTGYLINLASPEKNVYSMSRNSMLVELKRAEMLGLPYLVMHPGAHLGSGEGRGIQRVIDSLDWLHDRTRGYTVRILLETTVGQGTSIGYRFEHLAQIIKRTKESQRLGVCLDTCHVFAAGYDIRTKRMFDATFRSFDEVIGLSRLMAIHVNDSMRGLASHIDRHQHIGQGEIGLEAFRLLMNDERWSNVPKILETPKAGGNEKDIQNLHVLRTLLKGRPGSRRRESSLTGIGNF